MGARSGEQFLQGLRDTKRQLWLERRAGRRCHRAPRAGRRGADAGRRVRPSARVPRRVPDRRIPETGEPLNIGHMIPRSRRRPQAPQPRSGAHRRGHRRAHGPHARLHEREVRQLRRRAGRTGSAPTDATRRARTTSSRFQKRLAREDISLTHTIIHPTDRQVDGRADRSATRCRCTRSARRQAASWCAARASWPRWRPSPTRSRCTRRFRCRPGRGVRPGLLHPGRHARACSSCAATARPRPARDPFDRPAVEPLRRAGRVRDLRRRRDPARPAVHRRRVELYNTVGTTGLRDNMTNQTTIRALTKLEFAYGLATRMAEAIGDASPARRRCWASCSTTSR